MAGWMQTVGSYSSGNTDAAPLLVAEQVVVVEEESSKW